MNLSKKCPNCKKTSVISSRELFEPRFPFQPKKPKFFSYNVLQGILESQITYTKAGNPKGISGSLEELNGFGHKFLKINKKLLEKPL